MTSDICSVLNIHTMFLDGIAFEMRGLDVKYNLFEQFFFFLLVNVCVCVWRGEYWFQMGRKFLSEQNKGIVSLVSRS